MKKSGRNGASSGWDQFSRSCQSHNDSRAIESTHSNNGLSRLKAWIESARSDCDWYCDRASAGRGRCDGLEMQIEMQMVLMTLFDDFNEGNRLKTSELTGFDRRHQPHTG